MTEASNFGPARAIPATQSMAISMKESIPRRGFLRSVLKTAKRGLRMSPYNNINHNKNKEIEKSIIKKEKKRP